MLSIYCNGNHQTKSRLCPNCAQLLDYAKKRIEKCPWGKSKPACARCTIHCYEKIKREQIIKVMRYAGPKMALRHPILTFLHLFTNKNTRLSRPIRSL